MRSALHAPLTTTEDWERVDRMLFCLSDHVLLRCSCILCWLSGAVRHPGTILGQQRVAIVLIKQIYLCTEVSVNYRHDYVTVSYLIRACLSVYL